MDSNVDTSKNRTDVEKRFLAALLRYPAATLNAAANNGMRRTWLSIEAHMNVYDCAWAIALGGESVCREALIEESRKSGIAVTEALLDELLAIQDIREDHAEHIVKELREQFIARELTEIGQWLIADSGTVAGDKLLALAMDRCSGLIDECSPVMTPDDLVKEVTKDFDVYMMGGAIGLDMPWSTIKQKCGSIEPGQVCVVAGHGGSGKSCLLLQWALHLAKNGQTVFYATLEDPANVVMRRAAIMVAGVSAHDIIHGIAPRKHYEAVKYSVKDVARMPLFVYDKPGSAQDVMLSARRHITKGLTAVFIDSFKDLHKRAGIDGECETMSTLCTAAKLMKVPIIISHHIRKPPTALKDNPRLLYAIEFSDLRGSQRIVDDARMVLALQKYPTDKDMTQFEHRLKVMKANHGVAGISVDVYHSCSLTWHEKDIENVSSSTPNG